MRLMIGNEIWVFLKKEYINSTFGDIIGILIEVTDDSLYVQSLDESCTRIFAIPRENVAYCTTDEFLKAERNIVRGQPTVGHAPSASEQQEAPVQQGQQQEPVIDRLNVYVNKQQVASIPVPPTFPIHEWNENILRVIMGNPEVKASLAGKVQKEIEYYPGEVYITIENIVPPSQMPDVLNENTFQMGGQPTTEFLNPVQMAQRLSKVGNGGNDGETKV